MSATNEGFAALQTQFEQSQHKLDEAKTNHVATQQRFGSLNVARATAKESVSASLAAAIRDAVKDPGSLTDSASNIVALRTAHEILTHAVERFEAVELADSQEQVLRRTVEAYRALRDTETARLACYQTEMQTVLARASEVEGGPVEISIAGGRGDALRELVAKAARSLEQAENALAKHVASTAERRAALEAKENSL